MNDPRPAAASPAPFDAPTAPALRCPSCGARSLAGDRACDYCGSLLSTRRCPACFVLNPREALLCGRCGAALPPERTRMDWHAACPDCRTPLVSRSANALAFTECARCGGLFLELAVFEWVTRNAAGRAQARTLEGIVHPRPPSLAAQFHYRGCPVCHKLMNRSNYGGGSGVIVDVCRDHGVWFDRGELTEIVEFLESGGWNRIRKREKERLSQEVSELERRRRAAAPGSLPAFPPDPSPWRGAALDDLVDVVTVFFSARR